MAIKVIEKSQIKSPKQVARLQREIRFLKLLNHPHIVKVIDVVETHDFIYIIMEYAVGGELFDYIVANKRVKEKEAKSFFRMVLSAVDYCHQVSFCLIKEFNHTSRSKARKPPSRRQKEYQNN